MLRICLSVERCTMKLVVAFTDHDDRKIAQMDLWRERQLEANSIDDHRAHDDYGDALAGDLLNWLEGTFGLANAETLAESILESVRESCEPPSYIIGLYFHVIRA